MHPDIALLAAVILKQSPRNQYVAALVEAISLQTSSDKSAASLANVANTPKPKRRERREYQRNLMRQRRARARENRNTA